MSRTQPFEELHLRGIGRTYGEYVALRSLDLTVRAGEFIALLGPSGCGKSTALNCLAGLIPLTQGQILLDDDRVDELPAEQRDFGMVFQNYALFPHMSVAKNIAFGLEMRKVPRAQIRERVQRALEQVRLVGQEGKLPGQLSGGQQQRVAIARVIASQPRLVLMDEPLSNLDAKLRLDMRTEIRRLHQEQGFTTIYVTHDQEEALSMADRLVVLRDGEVQQIGTPEELYDRPVNWYVADFMGYRNLIDMEVTDTDAGGRVRVAQGEFALWGAAQGDVSVGDAVRVAIRPDDFVVGAEDTVPNRTTATVGVVEYLGREFVFDSKLPQGDSVHIRTPLHPRSGDRIGIGVPPERVLVYPSELRAATPEPALV
ncbi:MAG: ABC transporter ATP-binding protein [Microbacterium sp.]